MMEKLTLEQLGKYETHYVEKNGCIDALESLLGGIDDKNETQEIRSIAYSMYKEFHSDQKKRIIRNITIVSTITMSAAFGVFLLIRHLNPIVDIKLPIEVVSLTLAATCLLMLCYQLIKYESIEYRFDNRCSNEQDDSKTSMIQTNDSNDIVTLKTRLKRLAGCAKPSCTGRDNPQMVKGNEKPSRIPIPPSIHSDYKKPPSDDYKRPQNGLSFKEELKLRVSQKSCEDFLPPPPPCDDFKEISTWTSGVEKPILSSDRGR